MRFRQRLGQVNKVKSFLRDLEWPIIATSMIVTIILGTVGFSSYFRCKQIDHTVFDSLYSSIGLISMSSGDVTECVVWELEVARWAAPLIAAYTAVKALFVIFGEQIRNIRLRYYRDHYVLCGLGKKGLYLTRDILRKNGKVVIIEPDDDNEYTNECRELGAIVLNGSALDLQMLERSRVSHAKYLIVFTGDDGKNAEIAFIAKDIDRKGEGYLTCIIHVADQELSSLLKARELTLCKPDCFRLVIFNLFEHGSLAMIREFFPFISTLQTNQKTQSTIKTYKIFIIGYGSFGQNLLMQLLKIWKRLSDEVRFPLNIKIIGINAIDHFEKFLSKSPKLQDTCVIDAYDVDFPLNEEQINDFIIQRTGYEELASIYVCLEKDAECLINGAAIAKAFSANEARVIIKMNDNKGLANLLPITKDEEAYELNVLPFSLFTQVSKMENILEGVIESLAKAIHQKYLYDQMSNGITVEINPSMVPWERLTEDLRESNRSMAANMARKINQANCKIVPNHSFHEIEFILSEQTIESMAKDEHERWYQDRHEHGWRYGKVKNIELKTNPSLVHWSGLPEEEREKNRQFIREIPYLLALVGLKVEPK